METTLEYGLDEVGAVADRVRELAAARPGAPAPVYALVGELGAGKTTLTAALAARYGVREATSSPTFSIVNEYAGAGGPVYHLDCYRLADLDEALDAGLEEVFTAGRPVFVEWPAVVEPLLPEGVVILRLTHAAGAADRRRLTIITGVPHE